MDDESMRACVCVYRMQLNMTVSHRSHFGIQNKDEVIYHFDTTASVVAEPWLAPDSLGPIKGNETNLLSPRFAHTTPQSLDQCMAAR